MLKLRMHSVITDADTFPETKVKEYEPLTNAQNMNSIKCTQFSTIQLAARHVVSLLSLSALVIFTLHLNPVTH